MRAFSAVFLLCWSVLVAAQSNDVRPIVSQADKVNPLLIGQFVPDVSLKTSFGGDISLLSLIEKKPSVIIFYRGGWCPYCSRQLAGLVEVEQRIIDLGYQIIAISPDSPARLSEQQTSATFEMVQLSDSALNAIQAFGLGYYVDEATVETIKGQLGADVVTLAGESKVVLPVPAVYIADTTGLITFAYVNPNYRQRINPQLLYQAARLSR